MKDLTNVEIYPYKKHRKPQNKELDLGDICNTTERIDYTQQKYISLFKSEEVEPIIKDVLLYTMKITGSKDGFISIVNDECTEFHYYTVIVDVEGIDMVNKTRPEIKVEIKSGSLISIPYIKKCHVISNDVSTDPRVRATIFKDPSHPVINTFLGIPLLKNNEVIGQIGLANAENYSLNSIKSIIPLIYFFRNFVDLVKNNSELSLSQELKIKVKTSELKDTFIASMSHEMRTPLNGIIGMSRLLRETSGLTDKQEKYIKVISDCGVQLLELVNDVLDFSKISAGDLNLHLSSFNLKECIESSIEVLHGKAIEKGLELRVLIDTLPESVNADSRRIKQILINLLSNAIKFTEKGWIEIRVRSEDDIGFKKKIIIEVEDTGCGIKEDDCEKIFSVFTKATNNKIYSYDNPGAGLGLAINRELCRLMNGDISVTSVYERGSIFKAVIKVDDETDIVSAIKEQHDLFKNKTVICVDDNVDNRMFLMDTLMPWGLDVMTFGSAKETLKYLERGKKFDIIIIDICMPGMNGIELAQILREKKYNQPFVGLSSLGSRSGENWFDHFFLKPVSKTDLYNMIVESLENKLGKKTSLRRKGKDIKILVAEDDKYNRILMQELLQSLGYNSITMVTNGASALSKIKEENFDICFMDIKMPVMDGVEATKQIKKISTIPIIAVSASVLESDRNRFQEAGMDGYIPKPIDKDKLESLLKSRF